MARRPEQDCKMNELGRYIDEMRKRHRLGRRVLAKSQMAQEVGLNINAVQQLIAGTTGASPKTLKALADRWGTDDDYRELMRLAGHPLPEQWSRTAEENDSAPDEQAGVSKNELGRYIAAMRLAGHPLPDQWLKLLDDSEIEAILDENDFTPGERASVLKFVQLVRCQRAPTPPDA